MLAAEDHGGVETGDLAEGEDGGGEAEGEGAGEGDGPDLGEEDELHL